MAENEDGRERKIRKEMLKMEMTSGSTLSVEVVIEFFLNIENGYKVQNRQGPTNSVCQFPRFKIQVEFGYALQIEGLFWISSHGK